MSLLEAVAVLTGALSVYLGVRENVWVWPVGIVSVALQALVFWRTRLYADMGLQVFYVAASAYGWWAWLHGGRDGGELRVARTPLRWLAALLLGGAAFSALLGAALRTLTDAAAPWLDATLAGFSLVAQWQMTRKWIENWLVWIVVDAAYVGLYLVKDLRLMAGLYAVFLGLAVLGLREWRRTLARQTAAA